MVPDAQTGRESSPKPQARNEPAHAAGGKILSPVQANSALERLQFLCLSQGNHREELEELATSLRQSGYVPELSQVLYDTVFSPQANSYVGTLWMRRIVTSKSWNRSYPEELDGLCERGEIGRGAVLELLSYAAQKGRWQLIKPVLKRHGRWLRADPVGWPLLARALVSAGAYRTALRWTSGWQERAGIDLQIRYAVACALRGLGKERKAHPVVAAALEDPEAASRFPLLVLWFSSEAAIRGDVEQAVVQFEKLNPAGWDEDTFCLYYLARGVIRVEQAPVDQKKRAFRSAHDRIRDRFRRVAPHRRHWMVRRMYRRCLTQMGLIAGEWGKVILAPWRSADSWFFLAVLLLVPGLQVFAPVYAYRCGTRRKALSR
jgi:hypothetical protein